MHKQLSDWLNSHRQGLQHRQLLIISGTQNWAISQGDSLLAHQHHTRALLVGHSAPDTPGIHINQYRQVLGQEFALVIINCFAGFRASALSALSGNVSKGGLMVLLCPPLEDWARFPDPLWEARITPYLADTMPPSGFIHWLSEKIQASAAIGLITPSSLRLPELVRLSPPPLLGLAYGALTQEQRIAVAEIIQTATGRPGRHKVLIAGRGRGKSSALGLAVAELSRERCMQVIITAPQIKAVEPAFERISQRGKEAIRDHQGIQVGGSHIQFLPLDVLSNEVVAADLLIVDEAAAIPAEILKTLCKRHKRIVFSTTTHGYEGSGRGFQVRFLPYLHSHYPDTRVITLNQPIRWFEGDPVERFWLESLLQLPLGKEQALGGEIQFTQLAHGEMLEQPGLLHQAFSLLTDSHYQTTPDDLQRLVDSPDNRLILALTNNQVVGVAWCQAEWPNLTELASDICLGKRRPNGYLTQQTLGFNYAIPHWFAQRILRVTRIAVLPQLRNHGIGKALIGKATDKARADGMDFLATSFGATNELLQFWRSVDCMPVHLGHHPDAASGEVSCLCLLPLTGKANVLFLENRQQFAKHLNYSLPRTHRQLSTAVMLGLCLGLAERPLDNTDKQLLTAFLLGQRHPDTVKSAIAGLAWNLATSGKCSPLLFAFALQSIPTASLLDEYGLTGKKQLFAAIGQAVQKQWQTPD